MADNAKTTSPETPPVSSISDVQKSTSSAGGGGGRSNSKRLVRKAMQQSSEASKLERSRFERSRPSEPETGFIYSQRAFKKSSQNGKLTLYLASRDLVVTPGKIDKLQGVLLIDPEILQEKKVYGQVTLTFRYGREDEEVMGLKFCNEAIMSLAQLYPPYHSNDRKELNTPFQEVLVKRFPNAHPFTMSVPPLAPPSVQLVPAKEYNGAPIGTSYDVRIYAAERSDEKFTRKMQIIRMGIRVVQGAYIPTVPRNHLSFSEVSSTNETTSTAQQQKKSVTEVGDENEIKVDEEPPAPHEIAEKQFLLSDGRVRLEASLDRAVYGHGDPITVQVNVTNNSSKSVKRIEADIVQYVDVCMFSNGKFKNIVAQVSSRDGCPVEPGFSLSRNYTLRPEKGTTKNWIALEDDPGYAKAGGNLASTVVCSSSRPEDRNVFAIYVSYYVKVKIVVSPMGEWIGGVVSLKLPFVLMHNSPDPDYGYGWPTTSPPQTPSRILDKIETIDEPDDDSLPFIDKDSTSDEETNLESPDDKENAATAANGDDTRTPLIVPPVPTTPLQTVAKLTTVSSIAESTNKRAVISERGEAPANADLIEQLRENDKETRKKNT